MKSRIFKIHLAEETGNFEEMQLNKFLESVNVRQTFASIVGNEFWSILIFYDDASAIHFQTEQTSSIEQPAIRPPAPEKSAPEPISLNPQEEIIFNALRDWRNAKASQDGIPPYMIAHNDSLMQIAKSDIGSKDQLTEIKGFGEKRAEKYGDEILEVVRLVKDIAEE